MRGLKTEVPVGIVDRPPQGAELNYFTATQLPDFVGRAPLGPFLPGQLPYRAYEKVWSGLKSAVRALEP